MADPKKASPLQFITSIESVRLTNLFFRVAWKMSAGLIVLAVRLIASIVLRIAHAVSRRRRDW